jgi:hypothetical protein
MCSSPPPCATQGIDDLAASGRGMWRISAPTHRHRRSAPRGAFYGDVPAGRSASAAGSVRPRPVRLALQLPPRHRTAQPRHSRGRACFESACRRILPRLTEKTFAEYRRDRAWRAEIAKAREKLPSELRDRSRAVSAALGLIAACLQMPDQRHRRVMKISRSIANS